MKPGSQPHAAPAPCPQLRAGRAAAGGRRGEGLAPRGSRRSEAGRQPPLRAPAPVCVSRSTATRRLTCRGPPLPLHTSSLSRRRCRPRAPAEQSSASPGGLALAATSRSTERLAEPSTTEGAASRVRAAGLRLARPPSGRGGGAGRARASAALPAPGAERRSRRAPEEVGRGGGGARARPLAARARKAAGRSAAARGRARRRPGRPPGHRARGSVRCPSVLPLP